MLVRLTNANFLRENLEDFLSKSCFFQYHLPELTGGLRDCLDETLVTLYHVRLVWHHGQPQGVVITGYLKESFATKVDSPYIGGEHVIYAGFLNPRAWAEYLCFLPTDYGSRFFRLGATELEQAKAQLPKGFELKEYEYQRVKDANFKLYQLCGSAQTPRLRIRTNFYQSSAYKSTAPQDIFRAFESESSDFLTKYHSQIVSTYYDFQSERFQMSPNYWDLCLLKSKCVFVEKEGGKDRLREEWVEKGFNSLYNASCMSGPNCFSIFNLNRETKDGKKIQVCIKYTVPAVLDHKYNDLSIPYYRHILRRHILDYYGKKRDVLEVALRAKDGTSIWCYDFRNGVSSHSGHFIYKFAKSYLIHLIHRRQRQEAAVAWVSSFFEPILSKGFEKRFAISAFDRIAKDTSIEEAQAILSRKFQPLLDQLLQNSEQLEEHESLTAFNQRIHDESLCHLDLNDSFCTSSVLKKVHTEFSFAQLQTLNDLVTTCNAYVQTFSEDVRESFKKEIRQTIYRLSRKPDFLKQLKQTVFALEASMKERQAEVDRSLIQEGLAELEIESVELVEDFLNQMRRYEKNLQFSHIKEIFTLKQFGKMVRKTYPCVFKAQSFTPTYRALGESIHELLKSKTVRNSKRLYHHLRQIKPMDAIYEGNLTPEEGARLLEVIHPFTPSLKHWESLFHLTAKVEQKGSPEFLMAGNASVCCMSFGASNATTYAKEKAFGILNLYYDDRVVGNSVLWMNQTQSGRVLVLDNIEIHPNYTKRLTPYLKPFLNEILDELQTRYQCQYVIQGNSYNDLELSTEHSLSGQFREYQVVGMHTNPTSNRSFYSDAYRFKVIRGGKTLPSEPMSENSEDRFDFILNQKGFNYEKRPKPSFGGISISDDDLPF